MTRSTWILPLLGGLALVLPQTVRAAEPANVTIATWNLEWFFDAQLGDNRADVAKEQSPPSEDEWSWRRREMAAGIARLKPSILAVQEIESRSVLYQLTRDLKRTHDLSFREAFIEGNDFATEQDVGLLHQGGLVEFSRREQSAAMFGSEDYYSLGKHLCARFELAAGDAKEELFVVTVHLRAMPQGAAIRRRQCRTLRAWLSNAIEAGENVVVLGDLNSEDAFDKATQDTEIGILRGLTTADEKDDLIDLHQYLPEKQRATHLNGKQFDRILVSRGLIDDAPGKRDLVFKSAAVRKDVCVRGKEADKDHWNVYYKIPQEERDLSDHYPLVAEFEWK